MQGTDFFFALSSENHSVPNTSPVPDPDFDEIKTSMQTPNTPSILLINPPVAKPCEPPASIARLGGALRDAGIDYSMLDLNLLCLLDQFDQLDTPFDSTDTWSRRAWKNRQRNLDAVRSADTYRSLDRYRRVTQDLNRVMWLAGQNQQLDITLENYSTPVKSPLASEDLLKSAENFQTNHFFPSFSRHLIDYLENHDHDYIGLSLSYLSQALIGFALIGYIRKTRPDLKIIVGGGLMTSWVNSPNWNEPFSGLIDYCVKGAGEQELLQILGSDSGTRLGSYDYSGFTLDRYFAPGRILPYASSYGCYWKKCRFCPDFAENSCYIARSADDAVDELNGLIDTYNPSLIHLLDNAISPVVLRRLTETKPGIPWYGFARFEKDLEDLDYCRALKQSGCVMLKLGLESGSQRVLDQLDKGINLERAATILTNLHQCGIGTYVYLLFGTPVETEKEALMTLDFVRAHHEAITFFNLAIFNMPVCGTEAEEVENRFSGGDLSLYCDFKHPNGWDRKHVRNFLQKKFRKDPLSRPIDLRSPGVFGSNHAPLLFVAR